MKRSAVEIIDDIHPMKSVKKYDKNWKQFQEYSKLNNEKANEETFCSISIT